MRHLLRTLGAVAVYVSLLATGFIAIGLAGLPELLAGIAMTAWMGLFFAGVFIRERGRDYIDLRAPTWRELAFMIGGIAAYYAILVAISLSLSNLAPTAEPAKHALTDPETVKQTNIYMMMALAVFVGVPVEELIFRNGLQKSLTPHIGPAPAIFGTSAVFALLHYWSYGGGGEPIFGMGLSLLVVFMNSLILGYAYWKTSNLMTPIAIHAAVNTVGIVLVFAGV